MDMKLCYPIRCVCVFFFFFFFYNNYWRRGAWETKFWAVLPNIFCIIIAVFSLHSKMCIISHTPSRKHQITEVYWTLQNSGSSVRKLLCLTLLVPRFWRWLLEFWKIFGSLCWSMKLVSIWSFVYCIFIMRIWLSIHFFLPNNQPKYLPRLSAVQNFWANKWNVKLNVVSTVHFQMRCVQKSPTNAHKLFLNSLFLKYPVLSNTKLNVVSTVHFKMRCVQKSPTNAHKLFLNSLFLK
jgi:hypothetical protein